MVRHLHWEGQAAGAACHRRQVFAALHGVAHPGIRASRRLISHRFLWKGMRTDIANWCRDFQACQRSKTTRQPAAAVQPIPVPSGRFSHVHVDLVGPHPTHNDDSLSPAEQWPG